MDNKLPFRIQKAFLLNCFLLLFFQSHLLAQTNYAAMVNPFIGTGGHGHTFPGPVAPFGMVQVGPDTRVDGSWDGCSGYHHSDSIIYGFSHTHLSGTGCSDYGDIMLMPIAGEANFDPKVYSSKFSHNSELASAGFYQVHLDDDNIDVELTSTKRVGFHKYTFHKAGKYNFILDLLHRDKLLEGAIHIIDNHTLEGLRRSEAWAKDQRLFYHIEFSKNFISQLVNTDAPKMESGAAFAFNVKEGESILVKVSISQVDEEGAKKNMLAELPAWDFEKCKSDCEALWNKELNKIQVKGGTRDQQVVFYTALYHCFIHPSLANDVDGRYLGRDMQIHKTDGFNYYTVFSLWDTFRALHPLFNLVQRERNIDFIKTFLAQYQQVGRLPIWELSSNETDCMIGYHSVSIIADALAKGNKGFDMKLAIEAAEKSGNYPKYGMPEFRKKGYLEVGDENESVSKNLEYAYDDWCVSQIGGFKNYKHVGENWINLYNPKNGFMQPRYNGGWYKPFNPFEVNNNYTEANAWQYSMFVPHDIKGLIAAHGGQENFEKKLDSLFLTSSKTEGREQADISGLIGQYAHGNEPSHHMAYLYNYVGKANKTQDRVNQIATTLYRNAPDGLSGNEDCGQMSAWYIFSALGLYPVCPGSQNYSVSTPLFEEITINPFVNKTIHLKLSRSTPKAQYVSGISVFEKEVARLEGGENSLYGQLFYDTLDNAKHIELNYALSEEAKPYIEFTRIDKNPQGNVYDDFIYTRKTKEENNLNRAPLILSEKASFKDSTLVEIESFGRSAKLGIQYPGSQPVFRMIDKGMNKFYINKSCKIVVYTFQNEGQDSKGKNNMSDSLIAEASFFKIPHNWSVQYNSRYNNQYTAGGNEGLIDGIHGDENWRKGNWQGFQKQDFDVSIDLKELQSISKFSATFLQDQGAWILLPIEVEYLISVDGIKYESVGKVTHQIAPNESHALVKNMELNIPTAKKARYLRVIAKNFGKLPSWHLGAGGDAHIFVDEIEVR